MKRRYTQQIRIMLLAMTLVGGFALFGERADALTYQSETDVEFTFNSTLSVNLSGDLVINELAPGSMADSNAIDVGVSTNVAYGYNLTATVGSPVSGNQYNTRNLVSGENYFSSLDTNAAVTNWSSAGNNTWGYAFSEDNGTTWICGKNNNTDILGYSGLPLDNDDNGATGKQIIASSGGAENAKTVKFKVGAKAGLSQASGEYKNVINFYAVANPEP